MWIYMLATSYGLAYGLLGPHWKAAGLAFNVIFLLFGFVIQLNACVSNIYYINYHLDKRTWTYIFGASCATTIFVPSFHNYRLWSFSWPWYMANGQAIEIRHPSGCPKIAGRGAGLGWFGVILTILLSSVGGYLFFGGVN